MAGNIEAVLQAALSSGGMLAEASGEVVSKAELAPLAERAEVTCVRLDAQGLPRETFEAKALEVAEEGLVLVLDRPLLLDEKLSVSLRLRPGSEVRAPGLVRHVLSSVERSEVAYRVLVVFGEMAAADSSELREWMDSHSARAGSQH